MNAATDAHEALIEALGLTVRIKGEAVVNGVDLAVHAGEIVTLIGPNGSGKTTLVRAILGLVEPARAIVGRGQIDQGFRLAGGMGGGRLEVGQSLGNAVVAAE